MKNKYRIQLAIFTSICSATAYGQSLPRGIGINEASAFDAAPKIALLVGVGKYPLASGLRSLDWTHEDVTELAQAFRQLGYVVPTPLEDEHATRTEIRAALSAIRATFDTSARRNATLIFYFSGHGFGELDLRTGEPKNFLATYESDASDLSDAGLSLSTLSQWIRATGLRRQLLILDACRNSPNRGKGTNDETWTGFGRAEGLRMIVSTREGGVSWEDPALRNGVFTHYLIRGIRGEGRDGAGFLTASSLFDFVLRGVRGWSLNSRVTQVPFQRGEWSGEFLLGSSGGQKLPPPTRNDVSPTGDESPVSATGAPSRTAAIFEMLAKANGWRDPDSALSRNGRFECARGSYLALDFFPGGKGKLSAVACSDTEYSRCISEANIELVPSSARAPAGFERYSIRVGSILHTPRYGGSNTSGCLLLQRIDETLKVDVNLDTGSVQLYGWADYPVSMIQSDHFGPKKRGAVVRQIFGQ